MTTTHTPHTIVFDCADTLLRLDPPREAIFLAAAEDLGLRFDLAAVARAYALVDFAGRMEAWETGRMEPRAVVRERGNHRLCAALGVESRAAELHPRLLERFAAARTWVPFDDATLCLRTLAPRFGLHVLANWHGDLSTLLERRGLRSFFTSVHTSEELGTEKPSAACFAAFAERAGIDPASAVYVGNEYLADVVGSRAAGFRPCLVDRADAWAHADCPRIRSLAELPSLLD